MRAKRLKVKVKYYGYLQEIAEKNEDEVKTCIDQMRDIKSIKGMLPLSVRSPNLKAHIDVESKLKEIIGETGSIEPKYGGYEITILNELKFPWSIVFKLLLEHQFEILVDERKGKIIISCKSPSI